MENAAPSCGAQTLHDLVTKQHLRTARRLIQERIGDGQEVQLSAHHHTQVRLPADPKYERVQTDGAMLPRLARPPGWRDQCTAACFQIRRVSFASSLPGPLA